MLKGRTDSSGLAGGSRAAGLKKRTMQFLKDGTFKGRRDSGCSLGLVWQGVVGFPLSVLEGTGSEACQSSKLCSFFLIKYLFTFLTKPLPLDFAYGWWWVIKPHFLFGNCHWNYDTSQDMGPSGKVNPLQLSCPSQ